MELKHRSFRVTDETVATIKTKAAQANAPIYVMLAAAIDCFDPIGNSEHADFLVKARMNFDALDIAAQIDNMSPEIRAALLKKLKAK